jgi:cell shape-determining protein MreD
MNNIAFRAVGYGILHLILCLIYFFGEQAFGEARLFPLLVPAIIFGPLLFALEIYFRLLKGAKKNE